MASCYAQRGNKNKTKQNKMPYNFTQDHCRICTLSFSVVMPSLVEPSRVRALDGHSHRWSLCVPPPWNQNLASAELF